MLIYNFYYCENEHQHVAVYINKRPSLVSMFSNGFPEQEYTLLNCTKF